MVKFYPKFFGKVEDGVLSMDNQRELDLYVGRLKGVVELVIKKWDGIRTPKQNNFYYAYLRLISDELSGGEQDTGELHELFKQKFLESQEKEVLGEKVNILPIHNFCQFYSCIHTIKVCNTLVSLKLCLHT